MQGFNSKLFKAREKILIGVSGGLDSVVLLDILAGLKKRLRLKLYVVHFNHLLRGKNAQRDAEFAEKLADKYKLPFCLGLKNVKKYAQEHKLSLEDAARSLRYQYFRKTAKEIGATKLAVAHNRDDQIETILMRFLRGAAAKGLAGMAFSRQENGMEIVRPLLNVSRKEIKKYAQTKKLKHVEDETNRETIFLRNKIRLELIPALKKYNPNLAETILRLAEILQVEDSFLDGLARQAYQELVLVEKPQYIKLDSHSMRNYDKAIQRRVVRHAIERLCGYLSTISLAYVDNFIEKGLVVLEIDKYGKIRGSK